MAYYTNVPPSDTDQSTVQAFDAYYTAPLEIPTGTFDAMRGFFESKGFDKLSAEAVSTAIIRQSKVDGVNPMSMLDTLQGLTSVQMSNVVSEILNYNRFKTSFLGYAYDYNPLTEVQRNVVA